MKIIERRVACKTVETVTFANNLCATGCYNNENSLFWRERFTLIDE
jgi:hypothetical protein